MERHGFLKESRTLRQRLEASGLAEYLHSLVLQRPSWGRSIVFQSCDHEELLRYLERSSRFCRDRRLGRALHPRGVSFREIDSHPGLHLSIEPDGLLTVHLDRSMPAAGINRDGTCAYSHTNTAWHVWRDVIPSFGSRTRRSKKATHQLTTFSAPRLRYCQCAPVHHRIEAVQDVWDRALITGRPVELTYWGSFGWNRAPPG